MARSTSSRHLQHTRRQRQAAASREDVRLILAEQARLLRAAFQCSHQLQRCCVLRRGQPASHLRARRARTTRKRPRQPCSEVSRSLQEGRNATCGAVAAVEGIPELSADDENGDTEQPLASPVEPVGLPDLMEASKDSTMTNLFSGDLSWLSPEDTLSLLFGAGFRSDDPEWMNVFERLCNEAGCSPEEGVSSASFVQLLMGDLARRCEHMSLSLQEMLRVAQRAPPAESGLLPAPCGQLEAANGCRKGSQTAEPRAHVAETEAIRAPSSASPVAETKAMVMVSDKERSWANRESCEPESATLEQPILAVWKQAWPTESKLSAEKQDCAKLRQEEAAPEEEAAPQKKKKCTRDCSAEVAPGEQILATKRPVSFDPIPLARPEADVTSWGDALRDVFITQK